MKQTIRRNSRVAVLANSIYEANPFRAITIGSSILCLLLATSIGAQTFKILHSFTGTNDGAGPAGVILSGDTLYGAVAYGFTSSNGAIYAVKTNGSDFKTLHSFTPFSGYTRVNADGAQPQSPLVLSGDYLYGTTAFGGIYGNGTVFSVGTDGNGFIVLHHFTGEGVGSSFDGACPQAGLVLSGDTLSGTTFGGIPSGGAGMIFKINTDGSGFGVLHSFYILDGARPMGALVVSGNTLYGTTVWGSSPPDPLTLDFPNAGLVFKLNTDGQDYQILHTFWGTDGDLPMAGLLLSGNRLYGTTSDGGISPAPGVFPQGTVFALNIDGTGFINLHSFTSMITNHDGSYPEGELILSGNKLYGSTRYGGWGWGALFQLNTDGTGYKTIHNFSQGFYDIPEQGAQPQQKMALSGNVLYGTAFNGGSSSNGILFSLSLPITPLQPVIGVRGGNSVLAWPTNIIAWKLLSTTNLASPDWTPVSFNVVDGQNTVTNPISGSQRFFRLSQ